MVIMIIHNDELRNSYVPPNRVIKSSKTRWTGHIARMGETRNAYTILVGKLEGKRLRVRRRRWEGNTGIDLREI